MSTDILMSCHKISLSYKFITVSRRWCSYSMRHFRPTSSQNPGSVLKNLGRAAPMASVEGTSCHGGDFRRYHPAVKMWSSSNWVHVSNLFRVCGQGGMCLWVNHDNMLGNHFLMGVICIKLTDTLDGLFVIGLCSTQSEIWNLCLQSI